jgi:hypothetical protein
MLCTVSQQYFARLARLINNFPEIDIPGDGTGFLQSGLPFVTIHHYTGWLEYVETTRVISEGSLPIYFDQAIPALVES